MTTVPRRELDELYAKYDFHSNIFDIYVEGDFDFDLMNNFLSDASIANVSVFHIDDINVGPSVVEQSGFGFGSNKDRVLTLARLFDARYGPRSTNLTCLVDADCDRILNRNYGLHHASVTDYTCLESYLLARPILTRFLTFACQLTDQSSDEFANLASRVLPAQFALRAVADSLRLGRAILGFDSGLLKKRDYFSFSADKYLESYLSRYALQDRRTEVLRLFNAILTSLPTDLRHALQGHDFVSLLFEYLWFKNALKLHDKTESAQKFGGRLVALACRSADLASEPLFSRIAASAAGATTMRP
jgi:hypothetical protein